MPGVIRTVLAPNPSPLTLEGTRTYLVGTRRVVVIDPGPADPGHLDAVAGEISDGVVVSILLTHDHPDHAAGAAPLAEKVDAPIHAVAEGTLAPGDVFDTDAGAIVAVPTPGHTRDHVAFHYPAGRAVFCGDLMTGGMETALVAPPEGDLGDYLDSLERIRALRPRVIHPAHGPDFTDPDAAIDAYVRHRRERLDRVRAAMAGGAATLDEIVDAVYGTALDPRLRRAAEGAALAYVEYLQRAEVSVRDSGA